MDVINKDWGSSINYATIFYGGRRSMIEIKWLLNSNNSCNIGEEWVKKSGKYSDDIYGWPMDVIN